jgi:hypothetical protein
MVKSRKRSRASLQSRKRLAQLQEMAQPFVEPGIREAPPVVPVEQPIPPTLLPEDRDMCCGLPDEAATRASDLH